MNNTRHLMSRACVAFAMVGALAGVTFGTPARAYAQESENSAYAATAAEQSESTPLEVEATTPSSEGVTAPQPEPQQTPAPEQPTVPVAAGPSEPAPTQVTPEAPESNLPTAGNSSADGTSGTDVTSPDDPEAQVSPDTPEAPVVAGTDEPAAPTADEPEGDSADNPVTEPDAAPQQEDPAAASIAKTAADQTFYLESSKSDPAVIELAGGKTNKGTNVQIYTFNKSAAQQFTFVDSGKKNKAGNPYYFIVSGKNASMVLDVKGGKATNGANVQLWTKNGSDAQLWSIKVVDENLWLVTIVSKLSEKVGKDYVLELQGGKTTNGTNIQLYASNNSKAQRFYLVAKNPNVAPGVQLPNGDGVYALRSNASTGYATDIKSGSKDNGGNVQLWSYNGTDAQRLIFRYDGKGYYTIGVLNSAKVFDVASGKCIPGTNIQQWTSNGSDAQKWALRKNSNGSYTLINKATGLVLDITGGSYAKGTNIQGYRNLGSARQQFKLVKDTRSVIPEGIVTISPFTNSSVVFDIANGSNTSGGKVRLWTANSSMAQCFEVVRVGTDTYRIRTAASGGWLTGGSKGSQVTQQGSGSTESSADLWQLIWDTGGYYALKNVNSGAVLDCRGGTTTKNTVIQSHNSNGSAAQHFVFKSASLINPGIYFIRSYHGTQLDVANAATGPANLQAFTSKDHVAQKYQFTKVGNAFKIINIKSGLPVSVSNVDDFANVTQKRDKGTSNQLWKVEIGDGGYIRLVNAASGMAMAARSSDAGANVVQRTLGAATNGERWKLVSTTGTVSKPTQYKTRILMIGNSLTYSNKADHPNYLPERIKMILGSDVEVVYDAPGGSTLTQHTDASISIGANTISKLDGGDWDYVIIQGHSSEAITDLSAYINGVSALAELARKCGATPVIYGTWAYSDKTPSGADSTSGQTLLNNLGITRAQMQSQLQNAFQTAAQLTGATIANVGKKFYERSDYYTLYVKDAKHASGDGTQLAAEEISKAIKQLMK